LTIVFKYRWEVYISSANNFNFIREKYSFEDLFIPREEDSDNESENEYENEEDSENEAENVGQETPVLLPLYLEKKENYTLFRTDSEYIILFLEMTWVLIYLTYPLYYTKITNLMRNNNDIFSLFLSLSFQFNNMKEIQKLLLNDNLITKWLNRWCLEKVHLNIPSFVLETYLCWWKFNNNSVEHKITESTVSINQMYYIDAIIRKSYFKNPHNFIDIPQYYIQMLQAVPSEIYPPKIKETIRILSKHCLRFSDEDVFDSMDYILTFIGMSAFSKNKINILSSSFSPFENDLWVSETVDRYISHLIQLSETVDTIDYMCYCTTISSIICSILNYIPNKHEKEYTSCGKWEHSLSKFLILFKKTLIKKNNFDLIFIPRMTDVIRWMVEKKITKVIEFFFSSVTNPDATWKEWKREIFRNPWYYKQIIEEADKHFDRFQKIENAELPDFCYDTLLHTVMYDPVILPNSQITLDRQTIMNHLANTPSDPFDRTPLSIEDVIPAKELKEQIRKVIEDVLTETQSF
jgi:hypothetical protein